MHHRLRCDVRFLFAQSYSSVGLKEFTSLRFVARVEVVGAPKIRKCGDKKYDVAHGNRHSDIGSNESCKTQVDSGKDHNCKGNKVQRFLASKNMLTMSEPSIHEVERNSAGNNPCKDKANAD